MIYLENTSTRFLVIEKEEEIELPLIVQSSMNMNKMISHPVIILWGVIKFSQVGDDNVNKIPTLLGRTCFFIPIKYRNADFKQFTEIYAAI